MKPSFLYNGYSNILFQIVGFVHHLHPTGCTPCQFDLKHHRIHPTSQMPNASNLWNNSCIKTSSEVGSHMALVECVVNCHKATCVDFTIFWECQWHMAINQVACCFAHVITISFLFGSLQNQVLSCPSSEIKIGSKFFVSDRVRLHMALLLKASKSLPQGTTTKTRLSTWMNFIKWQPFCILSPPDNPFAARSKAEK